MILNSIYAILKADNATGGVFTLTGGRIYPLMNSSQTVTTPYLILHQISVVPTHIKGEDSPTDDIRIQVNSYDVEINDIKTLMDSVRATLDQYSGTVGTVGISHIYFEDEAVEFNDDLQVYKGMQDFIVRVNR